MAGKRSPVTVHHYERIAEVPEDTWNFTCNDIDPFHQYDFLRTVEEAHVENSTIRYLLFHKDEAVIGSAVLSLFPVDLPIFLGSNFLVKWIKRVRPRFFHLKMLFCGTPVSLGQSNLRISS